MFQLPPEPSDGLLHRRGLNQVVAVAQIGQFFLWHLFHFEAFFITLGEELPQHFGVVEPSLGQLLQFCLCLALIYDGQFFEKVHH